MTSENIERIGYLWDGGITLELAKEAGWHELTPDKIAFDLGHVDAIVGKSGDGVIEAPRSVLGTEDDCRQKLCFVLDRLRFGGQHIEPRRIMWIVFDIALENIQSVEVGGEI